MHTRLLRFTSQWALVGVILFFTVGIAMIARHMERIVTPTSATGSDTTETPLGQNIEKTSDTVKTCTPAKPVLTKIQTKIRCVEAILKKAVIEPYHINGQIEGLRITGLDRIPVARDLLLKSGDIILTMNGHSLNSKRRAYEIFKKARTKPIMIVDLLQDGEAKTLLFDFR